MDHILTNLEINPIQQLNEEAQDWRNAGVFRRFLQTEFIEAGMFEFSGLAKYGYVYYPESCIDEMCKIHMHLHACTDINQGATMNGVNLDWGILHYAATNNLIVILP